MNRTQICIRNLHILARPPLEDCPALHLLEAADQLERVAEILDERDSQDDRWGLQDHSLPEWMTILMEEVGELAAATLTHRFGKQNHPNSDWREEAVQVAAVALAMLELFHTSPDVD